MSIPEPRRSARVAPESPATLVVRDTVNVLVLVGGTVDPGNLGDEHRSAGYSRAGVAAGNPSYWSRPERELDTDHLLDSSRWYWQDNPDFREHVAALRDQYTNLHIFTAHGWSGDNSARNREIAGKYLADRLCGAEGERPYYQRFLTREVHFHVIGHSHGGNVVNEFCREAASVWPARWKIRTVVYLSTPFFQRLHQVDTGAFHDECKILNVTDDFDLTRSVLADFSLHHLQAALEISGFQRVRQTATVMARSYRSAVPGLAADLIPMLESAYVVDTDPDLFGVSPEARFDPAISARVYRHMLGLISPLRAVIAQCRPLIDQLHCGIEYPADPEFAGRICQGRQFVSSSLRTRWFSFFDDLDRALSHTEGVFRMRGAAGLFEIGGVLSDFVTPAIITISQMLRVGPRSSGTPAPGSLASPLTSLLVDTVLEQIDEFDNTVASPSRQLAGTRFASQVTDVNVTCHDDFDADADHAPLARTVLQRLSTIEGRYERRRAPDDIVDLLLTLIAHHEPVRAWVEELLPSLRVIHFAIDILRRHTPLIFETHASAGAPSFVNLLSAIMDLLDTAWFWCMHLHERCEGRILTEPPTKSHWRNGPQDPYMGELAYLAVVAHSQSRFDLYDEVRTELESQFTTRRRRVRAAEVGEEGAQPQ